MIQKRSDKINPFFRNGGLALLNKLKQPMLVVTQTLKSIEPWLTRLFLEKRQTNNLAIMELCCHYIIEEASV